jgi:GNAT superfamily N-acetyltransferase
MIMIRLSIPNDIPNLIAVASTIGFQANELEELHNMLDTYFASTSTNEQFWLTDENIEPVGVAYCEPERMTNGTWNLQLIAIHPDWQGQRRGASLIAAVEQLVLQRGGRMLIVETSGLPSFERARHFYAACGYEQEARIRDFYHISDDKIVFRKTL